MMEVLLYLLVVVLTVIPLFKLLPRFELNPLWSLAAALPFGVLILLWVMAARVDRLGPAEPAEEI